jgi:nicotinamidase/pyrazinamidase
MAEWLKERGARDLWVCGLATDFCVKFTAFDAIAEGFRVHLITDACRGIDLPSGNVAAALAEMQAAGVRLVTSQELP